MHVVDSTTQLPLVQPENPGEFTPGHVIETRDALVRNISFDLVARVGYLASRVCIPPFVLARVGLSGYGLWSAVFVIVSYVGISSIGFTSAYVKLVAEYVGRGDTRKANSILSTGLLICGLVCAALLAALVFALPHVLRWFSVPRLLQEDARYVFLLVVGIHSCDVVFSVYKAALAGCQKILEVQCIWVCDYVLEAVLIFWLVGTGHGVRGLADAFAISTGASIVIAGLVAHRQTPWLHISPRFVSRESWRTLLRFGGVLQFGALLAQAMATVERVIAAPLIGLDAVGLLDIGAKLPRMSAFIPGAFVNAFLPASSFLHAGLADSSQGKQVLRQLYLKGSRYTIVLAATMLGFIATAALPILTVWMGRIYPGTVYLMVIFSIQQHFDCMTGPGTSILSGLGRPWQEFAYTVPNILLAVVFIPLSHFALGKWSATGLGSAIAMAESIAAIGFMVRANRLFQVSWRQYCGAVLLPSLVPYLVGALIAVPLSQIVASTTRWHGATVIGLGGTLYVFALALVFDRFLLAGDERHWFREVIRQQWAWCKSVFSRLSVSLASSIGNVLFGRFRGNTD